MAAVVHPEPIEHVVSDLIGTPYALLDCWGLVRTMLRRGLGIDVPLSHLGAAREFVELWYAEDNPPRRFDVGQLQPWDLCLFEVRAEGGPHVGLVVPGGRLLHSTGSLGVHIDRFARYQPYLLQLSRHRALLKTAIPPSTPATPPPAPMRGTLIRRLRSPILGRDGHPRETWRMVPYGQSLRAVIPRHHERLSVSVNGTEVPPAQWDTWQCGSGDEVFVSSYWGDPISPAVALGLAQFVIGLTLFALSQTIWLPKNASRKTEADRSTTFAGIQSSNLAGLPRPIYYGRRRVGPVRLSADVIYEATRIDSDKIGSTAPVYTVVSATGGARDSGGDAGTVQGSNVTLFINAALAWTKGQRLRIVPPTPNGSIRREYIVALLYRRPFTAGSWVELAGTSLDDASLFVGATISTNITFGGEATSASARVNWLGALGEGPISAIYPETIEINGQPLSDFSGVRVTTRLGQTPQAPIPGLSTTRVTVAVGTDITATILSYTTRYPVTGFALNIDFNEGLIFLDNKGKPYTQRVRMQYRQAKAGGGFSAWRQFEFAGQSRVPVRASLQRIELPLWIYTVQVQFVEADNENAGLSSFLPTLTTVTEILGGGITYDGTALLYIENIRTDQLQNGGLDNVTVVLDGRTIQCGSFTATRRFSDNRAWITMDALRTVLRVPDANIDLPAFAAWAAFEDAKKPSVDPNKALSYYSDSPGGAISRLYLPLTTLDATRTNLPLKHPIDGQIGYRRRGTCSLILEDFIREQSLIAELIAPARVEMLYAEGLYSPRILQDEYPLQMYSAANALNITETSILDEDEYDVIQVQFNDEANNWERTVLSYPPEDEWPATPNILELAIDTVTNAEEIQAYALWELNRRRLPQDILTFETHEAPRLQPYDLFWFGWTDNGRVAAGNNTTTNVVLDRPVTYTLANDPYRVYVRHKDGTIDLRTIVTQGGDTTLTELPLTSALSQVPEPQNTTWAYGEIGPPETVFLVFRCLSVKFQEESGRYLVEALEHIPGIYDDPTLKPPATITLLPRTTDPPPGIRTVIAEDFARIDLGGLSHPMVMLSWTIVDDQIAVSPRLAPYDGAIIQRRRIYTASGIDTARLGTAGLGTLIAPAEYDASTDFLTIGEVRNGLRTFDDVNVLPGDTYIYKVLPQSPRRVPGHPGYATHAVPAGGVGGVYVPETPRNLRLRGLGVGITDFEGPDVHWEWDEPTNNQAFLQSNLVREWVIEIWGTDTQSPLAFRLHPPIGSPEDVTATPRYSYSLQQNTEDALRVPALHDPVRQLTVRVWARTQAGMTSLVPAQLTVNNAAPSMAAFTPTVINLIEGATYKWPGYVPPRDVLRYRVLVDTVSPPRRTGDAVVDEFVPANYSSHVIAGLLAGTTYYGQLIPYDTFGIGIGSALVAHVPYIPPQQWGFFVREFSAAAGLVFSAAGDTVSWTSGTLAYTNALGVQTTQSIAAGSGVRRVNQSLFVYYVLGANAFAVSLDTTEVFRADRTIIAVYNGGTALTEVWGAKMSGTDIIAGTIGAGQLIVGTAVITESAQIETGIITSAHIQDASITQAKIGVGEVDSINVADAAITAAQLAGGSVTTAKIATAAITAAELAADSVTTAKVATSAITAAELAADSVTTPKLAALSVTTAKIAAAAITAAHIQDAAITSAKIDTAAITSAKIGDLAVDTIHVKSGAITAAVASLQDDATLLGNSSYERIAPDTLSFDLQPGDVVLLNASCALEGVNGFVSGYDARIYEDAGTGGNVLADGHLRLDYNPTLFRDHISLTGIYVASGVETGKEFDFRGNCAGVSAPFVDATYIRFVGMHFKR